MTCLSSDDNLVPSLCDRERGVAFIMVMAVLMALMVLAAPFLVVSAHESRASAAPEARAQVRARLEAMLKYVRYRLEAGHKANEELRAGAGSSSTSDVESGFVHDSPNVDLAGESQVPVDVLNSKGQPETDGDGHPLLHHKNERGSTIDVQVRDEHAYPNLLSSPPFLIAGVLGRTLLTKDITDTDTEISGEELDKFPAKNGHINIEGEVISYSERQGTKFVGCQRGLEGGLRAQRHRADAVIFDDRAREIAMLPFKSPRAQDGWREPTLAGYVKEIVLLGRSALSSIEVDRFEREWSFAGRREQAGAFGEKVSVRAAIDPSADATNGFPIQVSSAEGFNPGTIVRITDGVNTEYGICADSRGAGGFGGGGGRGGAGNTIRLVEATKNAYEFGRTYAQPLLRHPVNINSAPREVLYRVIDGLQMGFGQRPQGDFGRLSGESSTIVVEGILANRPIRDFQHFRELLESWMKGSVGIFNGIQLEAVFRNAVDANDASLYYSTVPFTFASFDYYTIETQAVVNDQSGRELARGGIRERVHVSPSGWLTARMESQEDFEGPLTRARAGKYVSTFPYPTARYQLGQVPASRITRMLHRLGGIDDFAAATGLGNPNEEVENDVDFRSGVFPHREDGDVRLATGRQESAGYNKHFDGPALRAPEPDVRLERVNDDGYSLAKGPFPVDVRDPVGGAGGGGQNQQIRGGTRRGQQEPGSTSQVTVTVGSDNARTRTRGGPGGGGQRRNSGALMGRTTPNPLRFDLWYWMGSGVGGRHTLFDFAGQNSDEDRIEFYIDTTGELVGRVDDRTIDDPLDSFEEVLETRWAPEVGGFWQPKTWYHLGFAYRGTKPDDLMLQVDGFKRGKNKYRTTLGGNFDRTDSNFSVENADGWPERGVALVGTEVVAFERSGESFDVIQFDGQNWGRGQRGTRARAHASGEPVTLFGYSTPPRTASGTNGLAIPRGGAKLRDSLADFNVATFLPNHVVPVQLPGLGGMPVTVPFHVHDPSKPGGNILELAINAQGTAAFDAFPKSGGYVVIVSMDVAIANLEGGIELAYYESRAGNQLLNVSGVPSPPNSELANATSNPGAEGISLARKVHPVRVQGGPSTVSGLQNLSCVFPVSIALSDVSGLREPEKPRGGGGSAGHLYSEWSTDPEFIQLGTPDITSLERNNIEWVRYHHLDKQKNHILCDEAHYIFAAASVLRSIHLGLAGINGANSTVREVFPFRLQCKTDRLSDGNGTSGSDAVPCIRTAATSQLACINIPNLNPQNPEAPVNGGLASAAGWGDAVTVEGPNGRDRKLAYVSWAGLDDPETYYPPQLPNIPPSSQPPPIALRRQYDGHGWISFTESLGTEYRQRGLSNTGVVETRTDYVRILKFPSGELPDMGRNARAMAGGTIDGQVGGQDGYIDELRVTPYESDPYVVWDHDVMSPSWTATTTGAGAVAPPVRSGIDATVDEIPIANVEWIMSEPKQLGTEPLYYVLPDGRKIHYAQELRNLPSNDAGLVQIGDEIIAFRGIGRSQSGAPALLNCQRGFMNTLPVPHGYGENVRHLDFIITTKLSGAIDGAAAELPVSQLSGFFRNGGTVLINNEMIHYSETTGGSLTMPWGQNAGGENTSGLLRGRYGTAPAAHDADTVVLEMPYRYWDRYAVQQDSAELAYFGFSLDDPAAYFHKLEFDKYLPGQHVDVEVLVRTDPDIPWASDPTKVPGIYRANAGTDKEPFLIGRAGRGLDGRVFFKYLPGAFAADLLSAHDWKRTPELRSLSITYCDETRVLGREELR